MNQRFGTPRPAAPAEGVGTVVLVAGGSFQRLVEYPEVAAADVVLYLDVDSEVKGVKPAGQDVVTLTLAAGETLGTLTAKQPCDASLRMFLDQRPAVNLGVGLCQLRAVGALVARQLRADVGFHDLLVKAVFERLLQKHNGCLEHVEVVVAASTAGGTGGAIGLDVARVVAELLLEYSNATVHVHELHLGSLTYSGLGDRIHLNSAATVGEDLDYVLAPSAERHLKEVRSTVLVEAPMLGPNKAERDAFVLQLMQALRAREVQTLLLRSAPNEALDSPFGCVRLVRAGFGQALPDRDIAPEVARVYQEALTELSAVLPQAGVGDQLMVKLQEEAVPDVVSVEELSERAQRAQGVEPPGFWEQCVKQPQRLSFECVYTSVPGQMRTNVRSLLVSSPRTRQEFTLKLSVLKALEVALGRELEERVRPLAEAYQQFEKAQTRLRQVLRGLFPRRSWEQVLSRLRDPTATLVEFQYAVREVRTQGEHVARLQLAHDALRAVAAAVAAELGAEQKRLGRAIELLQAVGVGSSRSPLVHVAPLDQVLFALLEEAGQPHEEVSERLLRLLGSSVACVTLAGLAAIVGAELRPASVAWQLAQGQCITRAPCWGGKRFLGVTKRILVIPPMAVREVNELRELVAQWDPELLLVAADTARGGVNIVLLEIGSPRCAEDILVPFYRKYLEKALAEPGLYLTNGTDLRRWMEPTSRGEKAKKGGPPCAP
ncbi:MAG: hypothetical protein L0Z62_50420 [Gemmataceae bacterium]|nr:hypothetical protein [Gemmataceae bacterium]